MIFAMVGIQNYPSVVIVGLLFGFASGACKSFDRNVVQAIQPIYRHVDVSLVPSLLALLCRDMSELG